MRTTDDHGLRTRDGDPVALEGVTITGSVRGVLFDASVEQRFSNTEERHIEVVYTFPLPWQAVLLGVDVRLGERTLTGCVIEKQDAEARYETAIADGDAAILLEKNPDASYTINLGNLAPNESAVITLRYAQTLAFEDKGLRLLIPTVIAPRYGDPIRDGRMKPHQVVEHSLTANYPFDIRITLDGAFRQATVASPSHRIRDELPDIATGAERTVSLSRRGALDRDFVLVLEHPAQESLAVVARDVVEPEKVAVLASFCPRLPTPEPLPVSVKILVDCSGSMNGDSMEAARRALYRLVEALAPGDRFSLSRFGDHVEHRSRAQWNATRCTRQAARRWIDGLQANFGGTEMQNALMSTFQLGQESRSDLLLITDGEIHAIDRTIVAARDSGHRLFIVGIGSSPAESHLRRLSEATGGACDFVAPGEAVEPAVVRMFARLRSPRLTEVSVVWPEDCEPVWQSPVGKAVFNGDTVNIFALLDKAPVGDLRLLGVQETHAGAEEIGRLRLGTDENAGTTVSRMAAAVRVRDLEQRASRGAMAEARRLAVAYQLLTAHTNFLLVHQREEAGKAHDMPVLRHVKPMLPAGWGGTGTVLFSRPRASAPVDVPAVLRKSSPRAGAPGRQNGPVRYDIPVFLRRQFPEIDHAAEPDWATVPESPGLTPRGLAAYLTRTAAARWPTTYAELRLIGLGAGVVDWLELVVAEGTSGEPWPEETVVATFLAVMASPDVRAALTDTLAWHGLATRCVQRLQEFLARKSAAPVDARLADKLLAALDGMASNRWPDVVLALDSVA